MEIFGVSKINSSGGKIGQMMLILEFIHFYNLFDDVGQAVILLYHSN